MDIILLDFIQKYHVLTPEESKAVSQIAQVHSCDRKVILQRTGQSENNIYFIISGACRKYFKQGRSEHIAQIAIEGEILTPSASFFSNSPTIFEIETIEITELLAFKKKELESLYNKYTGIKHLINLIIIDEYMKLEKISQDRRVYLRRDFFLKFIRLNPSLLNRIPQKYLASYCQVDHATFSRLKHLLKKTPK